MSLKTEPRWAEYREKIEAWLAACVPAGTPERLAEAMRYSLLAGGKRLRPMLALEFCRLCGGDWEAALNKVVSARHQELLAYNLKALQTGAAFEG